MNDLVLPVPPSGDQRQSLLRREWLVTNGLGGYASGTLGGVATRRYHGALVAALPAPRGRWMMLNHVEEALEVPGRDPISLDSRASGDAQPDHGGACPLAEFRLEAGLPVWRYEPDGLALEKRVVLPHRQNTVLLRYKLLSGPALTLSLRLWVHFRSHNAAVGPLDHPDYLWSDVRHGHELASHRDGAPPLKLASHPEGAPFDRDERRRQDFLYPAEEERGYSHQGELWSPGRFRLQLSPGQNVVLLASAESWEMALALDPDAAFGSERRRRVELLDAADGAARDGDAALLVLAADQFLTKPAGRVADAARAEAVGDEVRTVIAGYYWFGDWGRDTMISLEGLTLTTGRQIEAGYILRTFSQYVRDGLIPNLFPEGERQGLYNTADATLWYFHALDRYLSRTDDRRTLQWLLPTLRGCIDHHLRGTRFNIRVNPSDGLLHQGAEGYQLTWMDAKVGDWVVTPRRGKAVEINALWYNALRLMEEWLRGEGKEQEAHEMADHAEQARKSFNDRFWFAQGGYLYDVIDGPDGDDSSCRPNQVFAVSLRHPVLRKSRWRPVLDVVRQRLLTPMGLRSLAPGSPDYKPQYFGDRRHRDAAYHQGTVWPWLIGPFVDAWLRAHPGDHDQARGFVEGVLGNLRDGCVGSINEICDAEEPYTPRGCIAQAWSVAEALRAWVKVNGPPRGEGKAKRPARQHAHHPGTG
jgi:predicted glycogen debranching enzyme